MSDTPVNHNDLLQESSSADIAGFMADMARLATERLSRRDTRVLIFHLLYASESFQHKESLEAIACNMRLSLQINIPCSGEVFNITQSILDERNHLDTMYQPYLNNWRVDRISVATKLIMRLAVWEMLHTTIDRKIIINEAIELSKDFAEQDAYRFINGMLDRMAKDFPLEQNTQPQVAEDVLVGTAI